MQARHSNLQEMVAAYQSKKEYNDLIATLNSSRAVMDNDCKDMLNNWSKGAWYYLSKLQLVLFNNAFQLSDQKRFKQSDEDLKMIFDVLSCLLSVWGEVSEGNSLIYCLEMRSE